MDDLEGPAGVRRRDHGLAGEERLVRAQPEVLVDRRVERREAGRVEIGELAGRDPAGEAHAPVDTPAVRELLEPAAVRARRPRSRPAGTARRQRRSSSRSTRFARSRRLTESTKSPGPSSWYGSSCAGCGSTSATSPVERSSRPATFCDVANTRVASPSATRSSSCTCRRRARSSGRLAELPELGAIELVRLAELMHEPHALLGVAHDVRGELRRHDEVDRLPVRLGQVEQPPEEGLREHAGARIPLERDGDDLRLVAARAQLVDERVA